MPDGYIAMVDSAGPIGTPFRLGILLGNGQDPIGGSYVTLPIPSLPLALTTGECTQDASANDDIAISWPNGEVRIYQLNGTTISNPYSTMASLPFVRKMEVVDGRLYHYTSNTLGAQSPFVAPTVHAIQSTRFSSLGHSVIEFELTFPKLTFVHDVAFADIDGVDGVDVAIAHEDFEASLTETIAVVDVMKGVDEPAARAFMNPVILSEIDGGVSRGPTGLMAIGIADLDGHLTPGLAEDGLLEIVVAGSREITGVLGIIKVSAAFQGDPEVVVLG